MHTGQLASAEGDDLANEADSEARTLTMGLIDFLAEVTETAVRNPVRDILSKEAGAPEMVLWLQDLNKSSGQGLAPEELYRIAPPMLPPEPLAPASLHRWIDTADARGPSGPEPQLLGAGRIPDQVLSESHDIERDIDEPTEDFDQETQPSRRLLSQFEIWKQDWLRWSIARRRAEQLREIYEELEAAAKHLEQRDDEYELVLACGLIRWAAPDGRLLRRHLVTEQILCKVDRGSAEISITRTGARRRIEDRELFAELAQWHPQRGHGAAETLSELDPLRKPDDWMERIRSWLGLCLEAECRVESGGSEAAEMAKTPLLSFSPALLLRPRSKVMLAEAYKKIAKELRAPDAPVPVALTQLVLDTDADQRRRWILDQGGVSGDVLGDDPLFPLPTNTEQQRVMELLKKETGVVVQGPPGTGKTHTIANLVCALLARGQRVLVTSQKDQALKVLRKKIPDELRPLCVLLAGGSKDAATELQQGLDVLSEAIATTDVEDLARRVRALADERARLLSRGAELNESVRKLREVEGVQHRPVVPGLSTELYRGTLSEIVRDVKLGEPQFGWIPPTAVGEMSDQPPLTAAELCELRRLLPASAAAKRRLGQYIPPSSDLPSAHEFATVVGRARRGRPDAELRNDERAMELASLGREALQELSGIAHQVARRVKALGVTVDGGTLSGPEWVCRAITDRLSGKGAGLWGALVATQDEAKRLQDRINARGVEYVVEIADVNQIGLGRARGWLETGSALVAHLKDGGRLRKILPSTAQKRAAEFLEAVKVNGGPPVSLDHVVAAMERLEAEVGVLQLAALWSDSGAPLPRTPLTVMLSELADRGLLLSELQALADLQSRVSALLTDSKIDVDISTLPKLMQILGLIPAAMEALEERRARTQIEHLHRRIELSTTLPNACPEIAGLLQPVARWDAQAYESAIEWLREASVEQDHARKFVNLAGQMEAAHPELLFALERTYTDVAWDERLADIQGAWAWAKARQFVSSQRNAEVEHKVMAEFVANEDQLANITERLAATEAMLSCLNRMTDEHARALRAYREHASHIGAGYGKKAADFRRAARAAMEKAKGAVPAWVVPLPNLLDNLPPDKNSFDVVIVDEASQVGLENLYLLWMAPRIIVVGDDKQCTPGESRLGGLGSIFDMLAKHLSNVDSEIRMHFTPKTNLYGLLSARSGKDAVVRLREHFRCMPEIIGWSSVQFYGSDGFPGLIPLRERTRTDLAPLEVRRVSGAFTEGTGPRRRNPVEAKHLAEELARCSRDPAYAKKSFGVVVLQGRAQVKLIEHEINARMTPEERQSRKVRVGIPADFQGDERDVIFLSMVVVGEPRAQYAQMAQQAYNVAASRARDQMWLFASVNLEDLKPDDLRASLMGYMLDPPSTYGLSPALEEVSVTQPCKPFESLLEQRVFRAIRERGYYVVPQYKVGSRSLDLVVVGEGGRLAVECDGHYWHSSPDQVMADARRDRELRRMRWEVIRIRESEFEFDQERELNKVWEALTRRRIEPRTHQHEGTQWSPLALDHEDVDGEGVYEEDVEEDAKETHLDMPSEVSP